MSLSHAMVVVAARDLTSLAECYAALGRAADGLSCLDEAAQIIDLTWQRVWEVDVFRVRGDLLNATGDRAAAEESYHRALAVARRQMKKHSNCAPPRASPGYGGPGQMNRGSATLPAPIYDWFTEGFDTADLLDAKALLDELAS